MLRRQRTWTKTSIFQTFENLLKELGDPSYGVQCELLFANYQPIGRSFLGKEKTENTYI